MPRFVIFFRRLAENESGAPAIEYALLAAVIALTAAVGMGTLGSGISGVFTNISAGLNARVPAPAVPAGP